MWLRGRRHGVHNGRVQQRLTRVATADGARIAVGTSGAGAPLLYVSGWLSHLDEGRRLREERMFLDTLAAGRTLVRYDRAGCGMSGPASGPPTLASELAQLDAVTAQLRQPLDVVAASLGAPVAAAWVAADPGRVRRLVLYGGWAHGAELAETDVRAHVLGMIDAHWGLGSDVLTDIFAPDAGPGLRARVAEYQRASSDAATARALLELGYGLDIRELLPRVSAPTLIVQRTGDRAVPVAQSQALASGIPGAELALLPGRSHLPYVGEVAELVAVIRRFLGLPASRRGTDGLTPRQREVAALIGEGRSNREIAERLGIELRSAEGHVERILERLGARSRTEIAGWWARQVG